MARSFGPTRSTRRLAIALTFIVAFIAGILAAGSHPAAIATAQAPSPAPGGPRIAIPALDLTTCDPALHIQNLGSQPAVAMIVAWAAPSACPPQAKGPLKTECTGLLKPGTTWVMSSPMLAGQAQSALVYGLNAVDLVDNGRGGQIRFSDLACSELFASLTGDHDAWVRFDAAYRTGGTFPLSPGGAGLDFGAHRGAPLAVWVDRACPDGFMPPNKIHAGYSGFGADQLGVFDPVLGGFGYYMPALSAGKDGVTSRFRVQNAGADCASFDVRVKPLDPPQLDESGPMQCSNEILVGAFTLAPGESTTIDPSAALGAGNAGTGWIRATQPLAVVVDATGSTVFTSYPAAPAGRPQAGGLPVDAANVGAVRFAPLVYRGVRANAVGEGRWNTRLHVQNESQILNAKVKAYFLDRSGDIVVTVVFWLCPHGGTVVDLASLGGLPDDWIGSARIESQEWWVPGTMPFQPPSIHTVVDLLRQGDPQNPASPDAAAYLAPGAEVVVARDPVDRAGPRQIIGPSVLGIPVLAKGRPGQASSALSIANLVSTPGYTDFVVYIHDQNGLLDFVCEKLHERQVEYIDLSTWGYVNTGFKGSAIISAVFWEHDVFSPTGLYLRNLVALGTVVVDRQPAQPEGAVDGRLKVWDGVPIYTDFTPARRGDCGTGPAPFATPTSIATSTSVATPVRPIGSPTVAPTATSRADAPAGTRVKVKSIAPIGELRLPPGGAVLGTPLGGLSGIAYDPEREVYYALSDDRGNRAPARFYRLKIDVKPGGGPDPVAVTFTGVVTLTDAAGNIFDPGSIDPEGIALSPSGTLFVSSEGDAGVIPPVAPFVREFGMDGRQIAALPVPEHFLPTRNAGVRNNLGFEPLAVSPDGTRLLSATESALVQDGPAATIAAESPARIIAWDLATRLRTVEHIYPVSPIPAPPVPPTAGADNGLVEMIGLDDGGTLLAMERSYASGVGNTVRLFEADLRGATDVADVPALIDPSTGASTPYLSVNKRLVADIGALGIKPDNIEGMTPGPALPDGRRLLILVSDDNFNPTQVTQFVALALEVEVVPDRHWLYLPLNFDLWPTAELHWYEANGIGRVEFKRKRYLD